MTGFQQLSEREVEAPSVIQHPAAEKQTAAAAQMLMLSLQVLSKRFVIALSNLAVIAAVTSVWLLCSQALPNPSTPQLVELGGYGIFILAAVYLIRK